MTAHAPRRTDWTRRHLGLGAAAVLLTTWFAISFVAQIGFYPELYPGIHQLRYVGAFLVGFVAFLSAWVARSRIDVAVPQVVLVMVFLSMSLYVTELADATEALVVTYLIAWVNVGAIALNGMARTTEGARALFVGVAASSQLIVVWLVWLVFFAPEVAFIRGLERLGPYGAGPVLIAPTMVLAAVLSMALFLMTRRYLVRAAMGVVFTLSIVAGLLTGSRSFLIAVVVASVFLLVRIRKVRFLVVVLIVGGVAFLALGNAIGVRSLERFSSYESNRFALSEQYWDTVAESPVLGLMGAAGESYERDEDLLFHTHNVYLHVARIGGIPLLFAWLMMLGVSLYGVARSWNDRSLTGAVLGAILLATIVHGAVNQSIIYPTHPWCWMHFFACQYFLYEAAQGGRPARALGRSAPRTRPLTARPA